MKLSWPPVPMMMLVGSPTKVAAPAMLAVRASTMRNGAGLTSSRSHTRRVTGAISNTAVTLSRTAVPSADTSNSRIMIRSGEPLARLADQIATYSNNPVWRTTLTMIIIPRSKNRTSQLTPVSRE
jgi:hypothetical protein